MAKKADKEWGLKYGEESVMQCDLALNRLVQSVVDKWKMQLNSDYYSSIVGFEQIHDLWYMMYSDMKAIYTLEKLIKLDYSTPMIADEWEGGYNDKTTGSKEKV